MPEIACLSTHLDIERHIPFLLLDSIDMRNGRHQQDANEEKSQCYFDSAHRWSIKWN